MKDVLMGPDGSAREFTDIKELSDAADALGYSQAQKTRIIKDYIQQQMATNIPPNYGFPPSYISTVDAGYSGGGGAMAMGGGIAGTTRAFSPTDMVRMRLGIALEGPAPWYHLNAMRKPDGSYIVFVVSNNSQHATIEDPDGALFPSDALIQKLRLLF